MTDTVRLEIGDFLPGFELTSQRGRPIDLIDVAMGLPIVILFFADDGAPETEQMLRGFVTLQDRLKPLFHLISVNNAGAEANGANRLYGALPFPVLGDPDGAVARTYGLDSGSLAVVIADANRRITSLERGPADGHLAERLAERFEGQSRPAPREVRPAAPVLYVPGVFDETFCQRMIALYETGGNAPSGVFQRDYQEAGGLMKPETKIRRDHIVVDPAVNNQIGALIGKRVVPEIRKAFSFPVKHVKEFKISCYDAEGGGYFRLHRDNRNPLGAGRRFAMTLNLNTGDYEGGYLRFPEYGPELYRPAAGEAVVFACNLLHEATPVTAGRRFVLLTFFFGPDGEGNIIE
ncbi:MAG: 2OG-Fe(II) oxygenase [Pseudomonadota bacterium]